MTVVETTRELSVYMCVCVCSECFEYYTVVSLQAKYSADLVNSLDYQTVLVLSSGHVSLGVEFPE